MTDGSDKFEAHITCPREQAAVVREVGEREGWAFSQIDGDPVLGAGAKCYLTAYGRDAAALRGETEMVAGLVRAIGATVLRTKVERIVYDSATGVDEIAGGAAESGSAPPRISV